MKKSKCDFKEGQDVLYRGNQTHIEKIFDDGTCLIANPDWDWNEEELCNANEIEYSVPYWIDVKMSSLREIKPKKLAN